MAFGRSNHKIYCQIRLPNEDKEKMRSMDIWITPGKDIKTKWRILCEQQMLSINSGQIFFCFLSMMLGFVTKWPKGRSLGLRNFPYSVFKTILYDLFIFLSVWCEKCGYWRVFCEYSLDSRQKPIMKLNVAQKCLGLSPSCKCRSKMLGCS